MTDKTFYDKIDEYHASKSEDPIGDQIESVIDKMDKMSRNIVNIMQADGAGISDLDGYLCAYAVNMMQITMVYCLDFPGHAAEFYATIKKHTAEVNAALNLDEPGATRSLMDDIRENIRHYIVEANNPEEDVAFDPASEA